jgi:deazaflavin-dependent oxidoreductase (nitroreductase family)
MDGTVHTAAATTIIRFERHLNHRIGTVWAALTEPDQLPQWLAFPAEIELRVGGRVHLVPGQLTVDSTVTALDPPHRLEYGWHDRSNENVKVRWELTPHDGGTRLVFTEAFPTALADPDRVSGGPAELAAWHLVLDRLEATLGGQQPNLSTDGFDAHLDRYTRTLGRPGAGPALAQGGRSSRPARQFRPSRGRRVGDAVMSVLVRAGLVPSTYLLTTTGRKTGRSLTHPATVVEQEGRRWLVAAYGPVSWVHNARAAGRVTLGRRGDRRDYAVREVPAEEAGPVLKRYVGVATATRPYFGADKDAPVEDFVAEADRHPVFELRPINEERPNGDRGR